MSLLGGTMRTRGYVSLPLFILKDLVRRHYKEEKLHYIPLIYNRILNSMIIFDDYNDQIWRLLTIKD